MWPFNKAKNLAAKQEAEKQAQANAQGAQASHGGRSRSYGGRSGGSKWIAGLSASGAGIVLDHYKLRQNARDAYHDSPQARAVIDRYADSVADVGLKLEATPKADILGLSDEAAETWSRKVEDSFDSWAMSKKQNRSGTMNWYQSHRIYQIFQHRDNDIFARLFYSPEKNLVNPLQFDFIDPDQIQGYSFTNSSGFQASNDDGIIRNAKGQEVGYRVAIQNPKNPSKIDFKTIPSKGEKSGRIFMMHGFIPEYAGQGRGYSPLAHALQDFENITDFSSATIKKAINQAGIAVYVKPGPDNPSSNPLEGMLTNQGSGPAANFFASKDCDNEVVDTDINDCMQSCDIPEATSRVPGSLVVANLNNAEDLRPFDTTAPGNSFDQFIDAFTTHLSASMSIPIEVLLMKFGESFSASRAALILFWRVSERWRQEMASDYLNPCYEMWLNEEIAAGRVSAPGWSDPVLRAAWINNRWIGAPMPNIDPQRTAQADKLYVEMGAQTLDRVSKNLNGSTGDSNRRKLNREFQNLPTPPWVQTGGS